MIYDQVAIANLKLQTALQEYELNKPMFPEPALPQHSYSYNDHFYFNRQRNSVPSSSYSSWPPDPKTLSCCVLQNYRPSEECYCCGNSMTDLEESNYVFQQVLPFEQRVLETGRRCCGGGY